MSALLKTRFLGSTKHNPCQICGNTTGHCKTARDNDRDLLLCGNISEAPDGWFYIGQDKTSQWSMFVPFDESKHRRKEVEATTLSLEVRDLEYRQLFSQLQLSDEHMMELMLERGMTETQVQRLGAVSVDKFHQINPPIDKRLPGVIWQGTMLNTPGAGIIYPVRDVDGKYVGWQIRLDSADEGGRYRWATSATQKNPGGNTVHVMGELPLAIHTPAQMTSASVALVEGTGFKPFLAADKLGMRVIGAAGGNWAASPQTLKRSLKVMKTQNKFDTVVLVPDAGSFVNQTVVAAYSRCREVIQKMGFNLAYLDWGQLRDKAGCDIDDLPDGADVVMKYHPGSKRG